MSEEEQFTEWVGTGYDAYKINYKKEYERLNNIINKASEELQKIIDEVNSKTLINVGQFAIRLEVIQDELIGGSDKE